MTEQLERNQKYLSRELCNDARRVGRLRHIQHESEDITGGGREQSAGRSALGEINAKWEWIGNETQTQPQDWSHFPVPVCLCLSFSLSLFPSLFL